jgi:intracellular septation protein
VGRAREARGDREASRNRVDARDVNLIGRARPTMMPRMKLLYDFLPIIVFFVTFKMAGVLAATGAAIAVTVVQLVYGKWKHGKVEPMQLVSCALMVVFGGATLLFQDETFIKWKPTVLKLLFAAAFLGTQLFSEKTLVERLMGKAVTLPAQTWKRLNLAWVAFFVVVGGVNLLVAYNFDTETWVNFKLFGILGLTLAFVVVQGLFIYKHLPQKETPPPQA